MEVMTFLTAIGGLMLAIIGFFLKQTMDELKSVKSLSHKTATKVEVLENKYLNMDEKFEDLKVSIKELTQEIKNLNNKIK